MSRRSVVLALVVVGCSAPAPPAAYRYTILFHAKTFADTAIEGAILVVDGVEAGPLGKDFNRFTERATPGAIAMVPAEHTLFGRTAKLALRFPTPCGTKDIPLTYTTEIDSIETELRERARATVGHPYAVAVERDAAIALPQATAIWIDDTDTLAAKVMVGKQDIDGSYLKPWRLGVREGDRTVDRGRRRVLWDLACAGEHDVTVDGKKVGVARATDANATAFLISTEPGICYRQAELQYSPVSSRSYGNQLRDRVSHLEGGGQVQAIGWQAIDYFLRPPDTVVEGDRATQLYALVREPCRSGNKPKL